MIKVGLTGTTCSGIDSVAGIFSNYLSMPVFDSDLCFRFLLHYREDIIRKIKTQFGSEIYDGGKLNLKKFNTNEKFNRLIDVVEVEVIKLYETWRLSQRDFDYTIFKSSILFERKLDKIMNYNISVFKPKFERIKNYAEINNINLSSSELIINSEMDDLTKNQMSTWTIHNYTGNSLLKQIKDIDKKISSKSIRKILDNSYSSKSILN